MGLNHKISRLTLAVLLACSGEAFALGLGELHSASHLGENLSAAIDLLLSPGERVDSSCFRLRKGEGDLPWLKQGKLTVQGGKLLLTSSVPVVEPILQVSILVTCSHDLRREYTLMLPPPVQSPLVMSSVLGFSGGRSGPPGKGGSRTIRAGDTPASVAAELYPGSKSEQRRFVRALVQSNRHLGLQTTGGGRQPLPEGQSLNIPDLEPLPPSPPGNQQRPQLAERNLDQVQDRPSMVLAATKDADRGDRLVLSGGSVEAPSEAPLRLSAELGVVPDEMTTGDVVLRRKLFRLEYRMLAALEAQNGEGMPLPPEERLKALQEAIGEIAPPVAQSPPVAAAPVKAPPPIPVQAAEDESPFWVYSLLALLLVGVGGALGWRHLRKRKESADDDLMSSVPEPVIDARRPHDAFDELDEPLHRQRSSVSPFVPNRSPVVVPASNEAAGQQAGGFSEHSVSQYHPESILDSSVDEVFSHNPVMELAEIMLSFGRVKGAAQALQEFIDQNPKEALQPWIRLLEVYRLADMREEFERLAKNLNENFNVELAHWDDGPRAPNDNTVDFVLELAPMAEHGTSLLSKPKSVEDMPHILQHIVDSWGTAQCQEYLQDLLRDNRGGARQGFPLSVAEELLFLSELLKLDVYQNVPMTPDIDLSDGGKSSVAA